MEAAIVMPFALTYTFMVRVLIEAAQMYSNVSREARVVLGAFLNTEQDLLVGVRGKAGGLSLVSIEKNLPPSSL